MPDLTGIDTKRASDLGEQENARFVAERPESMALLERARASMPRGVPMSWMDDMYEHPPVWVSDGRGAYFTDVDGHTYLDMYVADMSAFCGHAPGQVVEAVARRMERGNQFLLPGEDAIAVAEHLAGRYGPPKWQFTLSATQANTEVIRLARELTGRELVLVFDGKYHGEGDATLVVLEDGEVVPEMRGLPRSISGQARVVPFNDVAALASRTRAGRRRGCPRGARDDQRGTPAPGGRIPRGAPPADARLGDAARDRRDPHARLRPRRPHRASGRWSRTS